MYDCVEFDDYPGNIGFINLVGAGFSLQLDIDAESNAVVQRGLARKNDLALSRYPVIAPVHAWLASPIILTDMDNKGLYMRRDYKFTMNLNKP